METYSTEKSTLTVVGFTIRGEGRSSVRYAKVVCDLCHERGYYSEPIECHSGNLKKGSVPCMCGKSPKPDSETWKNVIKYTCKEKGQKVVFPSGKINRDSELYITDLETDDTWTTTIREYYTKGRNNNPYKINCTNSRLDNQVEKFQKLLKDDTRFKEIFRKGNQYYHTCSSCSKDELVLLGLCDGQFKTTSTKLNAAVCSCRCGPKFSWTEGQYVGLTRLHLKERGYPEKLHYSKYNKGATRVEWYCDKGHKNNHSFHVLHTGAFSCSVCRLKYSNHNGYYPERKSEPDVLYLFESQGYLKVGRSFKNIYQKRLRFWESVLGEVKVVGLYKGTHEDVYDTEQKVLNTHKITPSPFECTTEVCPLSKLECITKSVEGVLSGIH